GAKTGAGLYSYSESEQQAWVTRRDRALMGFLRVLEQEASPTVGHLADSPGGVGVADVDQGGHEACTFH
ncbi:MAG: hypothetical protein R6X18_11590, partial [Chloroflexota bacterium]